MMKTVSSRFLMLLALLVVAGAGCSNDQGDLATADPKKEFTPEPYHQNLDVGVQTPIDLKINLLNSPSEAGETAEFELMFTSRYAEVAAVKATFAMPGTMVQKAGDAEWAGTLEKNQTHRMRMSAVVNTDKPVSIRATVTLETPNGPLSRGTAYEIDLGEKDMATTREQTVEGYEGGSKLNIIIPQKKQ